MLLSVFLNILSSCIGFMASAFFAYGAITMTPSKIFNVAAMYWDANQHWGDSIADQRADYIVGGLLLLLSFALQVVANLTPSAAQPSLLQPFGCAIAEIGSVLALLLVCSLFGRRFLSKTTRARVRSLQAKDLAEQEQAAKKNVPSTAP